MVRPASPPLLAPLTLALTILLPPTLHAPLPTPQVVLAASVVTRGGKRESVRSW